MFFFFSKILTFLLSPLVWFFILILWSLKTKIDKRKRRLQITAIAILYIFSNPFIIDEMARSLEPVTPDYYLMSSKYDVAIVLGGIGRVDERQKRFDFLFSGDRLFQTIELYHLGRVKKILFSGGSGSLTFPDHKEGIYIKKYLNNIHIADSNLIIESESRNTYENAVFSKKILDSSKFNGSVLLVTSAYHMPRAIACFKKAGFKNITPYLTNRLSGVRRYELDHLFVPNFESLYNFNFIIHEWLGWIVYKMKGYI